MESKWIQKRSFIGRPGVTLTKEGVAIHAVLRGEKNGLVLIHKQTGDKTKITFDDSYKQGYVYQLLIKNMDVASYNYLFFEDEKEIVDPYAKAFVGHKLFGEAHKEALDTDGISACRFIQDDYPWKEDRRPKTAYADSIYYGMHVRGFTVDSSSKIEQAGTFAGVTKKIPYLKSLGITGVVLQPIYESEEYNAKTDKINYWGYQSGYYMAPKNAYAYGEDAVSECKQMIKKLHENQIEVLLQFVFPADITMVQIQDILSYWAQEYHVDGFQVMGENIPTKQLAENPYLADVKLWSDYFPYQELGKNISGKLKAKDALLATYTKEPLQVMRKFLKGDGDVLHTFLYHNRDVSVDHGTIKFLNAYDGFRLQDMVSYEQKHNEQNGEENRDGEGYNCSWNCGAEGDTKKKSILNLRQKQMKNALLLLMTSQGTPYLFMGDEWGKSSKGNNNPYCQDNELTWQKWSLKKPEKEFLEYTKKVIALRKENKVFTQEMPLKGMDSLSCGFPDISYHGAEAWKLDSEKESRQAGILFWGEYVGNIQDTKYVLYNMFWESHVFALPKLGKEWTWEVEFSTEDKEAVTIPEKSTTLEVPARSIIVLKVRKVH